MTGDEAYFVQWGKFPAGGYYDHPPMLGWWLAGLLQIGQAEWILRLPSTLLPLAIAGSIWWLVAPYGRERGQFAALLVLLQPAQVWNVLITTDTPLVFFSVLSVLAYVAGMRSTKPHWYALSGLLLACAFLSKYFAVLLGIAMFAHLLFARRDPQRWQAMALLLLCALPAPLYNLYWNSQHAWVNLLFNLVTRNQDARLSWNTPLLYLLSIAYLVTPFALIAAWKNRVQLRLACTALSSTPEAHAMCWIIGIPLILFAAISCVKTIGLHWLLAFTPFIIVPLAIALPAIRLQRLITWSASFALVHLFGIITLSVLPLETWKANKNYSSIVLAIKARELIAHISTITQKIPDTTFAMTSFSPAAILSFYAQQPVIVFGAGSYHGRQDDFLTDWRALEAKNIAIISRTPPDLTCYAPYFQHLSTHDIQLYGAHFYVIHGINFNYQHYRDTILTKIRHQFYPSPAWLPINTNSPMAPYFRYQQDPLPATN